MNPPFPFALLKLYRLDSPPIMLSFSSILLKYWFIVFHALLESFSKMLYMVIIQMHLVYCCNTFILVSSIHVYQMNIEVSCKMN